MLSRGDVIFTASQAVAKAAEKVHVQSELVLNVC